MSYRRRSPNRCGTAPNSRCSGDQYTTATCKAMTVASAIQRRKFVRRYLFRALRFSERMLNTLKT